MKTVKMSVLLLVAALSMGSCGGGTQDEHNADTTAMPAIPEPTSAVDTPPATMPGGNDAQRQNRNDAPVEGNAPSGQNMPDANGEPANKATGEKRTDMSKVPGSGHPGDNPEKAGAGSPNQ